MKKLIYLYSIALITLAILSLPHVAFAGDPIPGLDVKLGKNPGGQLISSQTTGSNGTFIFTGLKPAERCIITFDEEQVQKMAIKEQGIPQHKGKSVSIVISFKDAGTVMFEGKTMSKHDEIDITSGKAA